MSKLNDIIKTHGIDKLNTLTKYPSIMTYHNLGEKGSLVESLVDDRDFASCEKCFITEKIDGTNARIIFDGSDYIIGSREELLSAKGDRFGNPQLNIVNTIKEVADRLVSSSYNFFNVYGGVRVLYGEVFGGNVTQASKQYTVDKTFGFRIFDVADVKISILDEPIDKISSWREHGGQDFVDVDTLHEFGMYYSLETVPYVSNVDGGEMPKDRISTFRYLQKYSDTKAGINYSGRAEGIVVRNFDRSLIRKIRFEDYERTAKREEWVI